ncbi:alanine dehydrogenase [Marinococcus halophilus]|uniref:Alanine dehydrogenase n=1 Tax=Marinococcus halophilus TaxID=1371 RepID=A0A510Y986_MARHA|nr:alanine dehydrogenase [Marinococcus halophilus]OZT79083.1 alanine dehydrogenase [Marinococcus halophilus]GEK59934.1 alanine dehydrogenase [Marinococcus halophilus]
MIIGIPKEIKNQEKRVAITPAGVLNLKKHGHEVLVEASAGKGSGFEDHDYKQAGASMVPEASQVWSQADMVMKVKEPLEEEYVFFRKNLILFTYLHLAAEPALVEALTANEVTAIAYETVQENGSLPLLTPMSEVAGRMAAQVGAQFLESVYGGKGILLSGVPGVKKAKVTVIGGGVVGINAARIAHGLGANVTIIDLNPARLREIDETFDGQIQTISSNPLNIAQEVQSSDLVIGAVLIPGARAPKLVTRDMIKTMAKGSVVVDVAIDQGGIIETADKVTTHENPTYDVEGVVHYAVGNMPGAVPRTSTIALTNVTIPYALQIANKGVTIALKENSALGKGLNTADGKVTFEAVAKDLGYPYVSLEEVLNRNLETSTSAK